MKRLLAKSPQPALPASTSWSNRARIPKQFALGPHTITVKLVSMKEMGEAQKLVLGEEPGPKEELFGLCAFNENTIFVRRVTKRFTKSQQLHTFWHEYFHMLLSKAGRERLSLDETLVDTLGLLQLQALNTMT